MASLKIDLGQAGEYFKRFGRFGGEQHHVTALLGDDELMAWYVAQLAQHPRFRLIHGRFAPLADKLERVKGWPGVTATALATALAEFNVSERKRRYESAIAEHQLLDVVITVYRESTPATLLYARDRMHDTVGDKFVQWEDAYGKGDVDDKRVRLLQGIHDHRNCVCIEVVDLGAHFNPKDGFIPKDVRGPNAATFAVIYAASQNLAWVRQMDGSNVPFALVGGLELNVPGYGEWTYLPEVWFGRDDGAAKLGGAHCGHRAHRRALPVLWE